MPGLLRCAFITKTDQERFFIATVQAISAFLMVKQVNRKMYYLSARANVAENNFDAPSLSRLPSMFPTAMEPPIPRQ